MEQQSTPVIVKTEDINKRTEDLPTLDLGIRDEEKPEYIRIVKPQEKLEEMNTFEEREAVRGAVKYAIDGNDYQRDLDTLHKYVPKYVPEGSTTNAHDSYIHDVLKRGKPNADTVIHLLDHAIYNEHNDEANKSYLNSKWMPLIKHHTSENVKYSDFQKTPPMTTEEVKSIPNSLYPKSLRQFVHTASGTVFEHRPETGQLHLLKHTDGGDKISFNDHAAEHIHNQLGTSYSMYPSEDVVKYTVDSAPVNRYLHLKHKNTLFFEDETILGKTIPEVSNLSDNITSHIKRVPHPTHLNDFHVYTGVSKESDPLIHSHVDEHGNSLFHIPAFTSTSLHRSIATEFTKGKPNEDGRKVHDVFKIRVPGGYPSGMYVQPHSEHTDELEYLLNKSHTLKLKPNPRHYNYSGKLIREWDAEIHHPDVLNKPFEEQDTHSKVHIAMHPNSSQVDIEKAAKDDNSTVRAAAAKHPRLSVGTMRDIFDNEHSAFVRTALMKNPALPSEFKDAAIAKSDSHLQQGLAERDDLSQHHIEQLAKSEWPKVNAIIARRTDIPHHVAESLSKETYPDTLKALASNRSVHSDILDMLGYNESHEVRKAVAKNPNIKFSTAIRLSIDQHPLVRSFANNNPAILQDETH